MRTLILATTAWALSSTAGAQSFLSIDRVSDELVSVTAAGSIDVIGPIGSDVADVDLAWLGGVLYATDQHYPVYTDLLTIDPATGAELSRIRVTLGGADIGVEGLAEVGGQLLVGYGPPGSSENLGVLSSVTGVITPVVSFGSVADMDGLGSTETGALFSVDADSSATKRHSTIHSVGTAPPSYVSLATYGSPGNDTGLHDLAFLGDLCYALDLWSQRIHTFDANTWAQLGASPLSEPRSLLGLVPAAGTPVATYCTAGTSASGCKATLSASGTASAAASSGFSLNASTVEGAKDGLFFMGTNGRQANSWGNGTSFQCVVPPVSRAGLLTGTGTAGLCDGSFSLDLNALWCSGCPKPQKNPGAGAIVQAQLWYRDPQNTSNQTTSLSDAIEFSVFP